MKNKSVYLGILIFLLTCGVAANYLWMNRSVPKKQMSMLPHENKTVNDQQVFNEKEGWGFVKSHDGRTPEITAHQKSLITKYNALFVGNTNNKKVTLTFDMGYEKEGMTPRILQILKKYNVKASFFVTTYWIEKNPELAKQLVKEGHVLGNHTVKHKSLPTLTDEQVKQEIKGWEEVALRVANYKNKHNYMRPPMGEYSERTLKITKELGYKTAFWSVAIKDWLPMGGSDKAITGIVSQIHSGAVVLLHGNSEDVVGGLDQIILNIREKGYKIVPINQI